MGVNVKTARFSGFCPGVKMALKMVEDTLSEEDQAERYSVGPIIHNPTVVNGLSRRGLKVLPENPRDWEDIELKGHTVVIRSHGLGPVEIRELERRGARIMDATCPIVKKAQQAALSLKREGYEVMIVGNPRHPEVVAIVEQLGGDAVVVSNPEEASNWLNSLEKKPEKVGLTAQTTISLEIFQAVVDLISRNVPQVKALNTLCKTTQKRQRAARRLSRKVDLMLVVGGKNSSNTHHLKLLCEEEGVTAHHVERAEELKPEWFKGIERVGIVGGASTPDHTLDEVYREAERISSELDR